MRYRTSAQARISSWSPPIPGIRSGCTKFSRRAGSGPEQRAVTEPGCRLPNDLLPWGHRSGRGDADPDQGGRPARCGHNPCGTAGNATAPECHPRETQTAASLSLLTKQSSAKWRRSPLESSSTPMDRSSSKESCLDTTTSPSASLFLDRARPQPNTSPRT